jgi:prophage antirepressor-like protein
MTMSDSSQNPESRIALFQRKEVRRAIHNNEWWFVITDVVAVLTDSANPQGYFRDMRRRDLPLAETLKGGGQFAPHLALNLKRRVDANCSSAGIPRAFSA